MNQEEHMERIERGRMASAAHGFVVGFVEHARENIVQAMIHLYRAKILTHDQAVGHIGGLAALEDLLTHLKSVERQGEISAEKEYGNGKSTEN